MKFREMRYRWLITIAALAFLLIVAAPAANAADPCCEVTAMNPQTGVVTAKVNATGQLFQFRTNNPAHLRNLKIGQQIYANLTSRQVSLDGRSAFATISSIAPQNSSAAGAQRTPAAPLDGVRATGTTSAAPLDGVRATGTTSAAPLDGVRATGPAPAAPLDGLRITAISASQGRVTVQLVRTGEQLYFNVPSSGIQAHNLAVGQTVPFAQMCSLQARGICPCGQHTDGTCACACGVRACEGSCKIGECRNGVGGPGGSGVHPPVPLSGLSAPTTTSPGGTFGHIVGVSGANATVQVNASDTTLQFGPRPQDVPHLLPNQKVWISQGSALRTPGPKGPLPTMITYLPWPQSLERSDNLGHGHHMDTKIVISSTGRIDATTKTWSSEALRGFHGGVVILLESDQCNSQGDCDHLYQSAKVHCYGVDGTAEGSSSRTDLWSENVDSTLLAQTRHIKIIQLECPKDEIDKFLAQAKTVTDIAVNVVKVGQAVAGASAGGSGGGN